LKVKRFHAFSVEYLLRNIQLLSNYSLRLFDFDCVVPMILFLCLVRIRAIRVRVKKELSLKIHSTALRLEFAHPFLSWQALFFRARSNEEEENKGRHLRCPTHTSFAQMR